jgi:DNA-binding XRE family transcriptional regulator
METRKREYHGLGKSSTYHTWAGMKQRCYNPKQGAYRNYGARGIVVCDRWKDSFAAFVEDMGEKPDGLSLGRVDNDGPYSPENCRWQTASEQARNTRRTKRVEMDGVAVPLIDVLVGSDLTVATVKNRLGKGWSLEEALGLVPHLKDSFLTFDGLSMSQADWSTRLGITRQALDQRLNVSGWSVERALSTPKLSKGEVGHLGADGWSIRSLAHRESALGALISDRRLALRLRQVELGQLVGVDAVTVSNWETGRSVPSLVKAVLLSRCLGLSFDVIADAVA